MQRTGAFAEKKTWGRVAAAVTALAAVLMTTGCGGDTSPVPIDTKPSFQGTVDDQSYPVGEAIGTLTLPAAAGGDGELSYALQPQVPGLTFDADARTLSGTPAQVGVYEMTYTAADADSNTADGDAASLTFTITVQQAEPAADTAPIFEGAAVNQSYVVGQPIEALTLPAARGGNGALTYSLDPTVPGLTFNAATRTLSGTPTTAGTYGMAYTVQDGDENAEASDSATQSFTISVEEAPPSDTAPSFTVMVADQRYTVGTAISTLTLPEATGGEGTLSYSLGPMIPNGLTFDAATRTLSGTPTTAGTYGMTYTVQDGDENIDASDSATQSFTIFVEEVPPPPDTAPSFTVMVADQRYTVGTAIAALTLPEATGGEGTLSYSLGPMIPDGLTFDAATRTLSGTPDTPGTYEMTYTVVDADENTADSDADTLTFTIKVDTKVNTVAIRGTLEDSETDTGSRGEVRAYKPNPDGTLTLLDSDRTGAQGRFNLSFPPQSSEIELQARLADDQGPQGFVRTITMYADQSASDLLIRSVPFTGLNGPTIETDITTEQFREFVLDAIDGLGYGIRRWDLDRIQGIEIIDNNPIKEALCAENKCNEPGHFTHEEMQFIKAVIQEDMPVYFDGREITVQIDSPLIPESGRHYSVDGINILVHDGWIIIVPVEGATSVSAASVAFAGDNHRIKGLITVQTTDPVSGERFAEHGQPEHGQPGWDRIRYIVSHEMAHVAFYIGGRAYHSHADGLAPQQSIISGARISRHGDWCIGPCFVDRKAGMLIYEDTFPTGTRESEVLGMSWRERRLPTLELEPSPRSLYVR